MMVVVVRGGDGGGGGDYDVDIMIMVVMMMKLMTMVLMLLLVMVVVVVMMMTTTMMMIFHVVLPIRNSVLLCHHRVPIMARVHLLLSDLRSDWVPHLHITQQHFKCTEINLALFVVFCGT